MRILLVDDDEAIAKALATVLTEQRHIVNIATDGQIGWDFAQSYAYDLIVLDVMLPKLDGVSLCQQLRRAGHQMPILLLTARDTHTDKVKGLDAGADDYVVKPFDWSELLARIRALLRREGQPFFLSVAMGDLCLNPATCDITYQDQPLTLRPKEYSLLELFLRNPRRIFSCGAILEHLWSFEDSPGEETVRAHIKGLRQKLKTVGVADFIETVYGLGYRLKTPGRREGEIEKVPPSQSQSPLTLQEAIAETWETVKPNVLKQVMAIEQANAALQAGILSLELQQQAKMEAHKLAGLVGSFGFSEGSNLARKIENLLESESYGERRQAKFLQEWVTALRQELISFPKERENEQSTESYERTKKNHGEPIEQANAAKILIADNDPQMLSLLKTLLEPWGLLVRTLAEPRNFWDILEQESPDLLILDVDIPYFSSIELCRTIRNNLRWAGLPVLFLTAHTDIDIVQQMFIAGADDFVSKPIVGPELLTRIMTRIERSRLWRRLAETDTLTQLANRTKFTAELHRLLQTADRLGQPLCLAVLSLDNLKQINYQYGYGIGDAVLSRVGELLGRWFCSEDVVARWSGNKFVVGMYGLDKTEGTQRLTQFLTVLRQEIFTAANSTQLQIIFNGGIAPYPLSQNRDLKVETCPNNNNHFTDRAADFEALYQAAEADLDGSMSTL